MEKNVISVNGNIITTIKGNNIIITDTQSTTDLLSEVFFNNNCQRIAIYKENISEDFFKLSTGIAGEVLQKFVNFKTKLAVIGDFSAYSSKPLKDFIYECNCGNQIFFVESEQKAIERLSTAV